jgi:hypothetical protein
LNSPDPVESSANFACFAQPTAVSAPQFCAEIADHDAEFAARQWAEVVCEMERVDVEADAVSLAPLFEFVSEMDDGDFEARAVALAPRLGEVVGTRLP